MSRDFTKEFLTYIQVEKGLARHTLEGYKRDLARLHTWATANGKQIAELTRADLRKWIAGLSRVPVSVAYPMLSLGYVVNAVAAQYLFGEAVSMQRWLGIGFIVLGVWLVARST